MLVLTRRRGEVLYIGDDIVMTVLDIQDSSIRIGIEAPRDVQILRAEARKTEPKDYADRQ